MGRALRPLRRARGHGPDQAAQDHPGLLQHPQPGRADLPGTVGVNDESLPIGIHHGSLDIEARRKVEAAMADGKCARSSPPPASTSASTGATSTSSSRWARPRAARACCSASAAPTTGSTSRARAMIVPGNRFEYLEARAALDAIDEGELDPEISAPARSTCSPSTSSASPAPGRSTSTNCSPKSAPPRPMPASRTRPSRGPQFHRHRRLCAQGLRPVPPPRPGGRRPLAHRQPDHRPAASHERRRHRRAADDRRPLPTAAGSARSRRASPPPSRPATTSSSPASASRCQLKDTDIIVQASAKSARLVTYGGQRMSMSTHLADRVRAHARRPRRVAALPR